MRMTYSRYLGLTFLAFVLLTMPSCLKLSTDGVHDTMLSIREASEKRKYSPRDPLASDDAIGIHFVLDGVIYKGFNTKRPYSPARFHDSYYSFRHPHSFLLTSDYEYRVGVTKDKGYGFTNSGELSFCIENDTPIESGMSICFDSKDYSFYHYFTLQSSVFQVAHEQYTVNIDRIDIDNNLLQLSFEGEISTKDGNGLTVREGLLRAKIRTNGLEDYQ